MLISNPSCELSNPNLLLNAIVHLRVVANFSLDRKRLEVFSLTANSLV
jgi:hypothetical protein